MSTRDSHDIYVGGHWVRSDGDLVEILSAHDQTVIGAAPVATRAEVDAAVAAARTAFDSGPWPHLPLEERIAAVERIAAGITARADELAELITRENGSPITFSQLGQVGGLSVMFPGFITAAREFGFAERLTGVMGEYDIVREPVGVVLAITAFNVPQVIIIGKLIPALLAGCTVIVKPSPDTPLDALLLAEIIDDAGLPEGVVSIIPTSVEDSEHLVSHPDVDMVTFTGSTPVGRAIGAACGGQMKRVALELGGKSAAIILDDANLDKTVAGLRFSSFINNGQACAAQTRILVPHSRYDEVVGRLAAEFGTFVVGDPLDPVTEIGPVVNRRQQQKILDFIRLGMDEGARVVIGGPEPIEGLEAGNYVRPTLFVDVSNDMRIAQEEIFGPVVVVIPYDDEDDAVRIANDSIFGLAGSVWTDDNERGRRVAARVRTGSFGVNRFGPDPSTAFGGFKASGVGREYGVEGLREFVEIKTIHGL